MVVDILDFLNNSRLLYLGSVLGMYLVRHRNAWARLVGRQRGVPASALKNKIVFLLLLCSLHSSEIGAWVLTRVSIGVLWWSF